MFRENELLRTETGEEPQQSLLSTTTSRRDDFIAIDVQGTSFDEGSQETYNKTSVPVTPFPGRFLLFAFETDVAGQREDA
jgi:hypothetical protein